MKKAAAEAAQPPKKVQLGRPGNTLQMGIVGLPNVGKSSTFNDPRVMNLSIAAAWEHAVSSTGGYPVTGSYKCQPFIGCFANNESESGMKIFNETKLTFCLVGRSENPHTFYFELLNAAPE